MTRGHYDALLEQLHAHTLALGALVADTIGDCMTTLERSDVAQAQRLIAADSHIDAERYEVENEAFLLIATQQPTARDLRTVTAILTIATELERMGDYCEGIAKITLRMAADEESGLTSSAPETGVDDLRTMAELTQRLFRQSLQAFNDRDLEAAAAVWMQDDAVDALYERAFRELLAEMAGDSTMIRRGTYLLWVAHNLERVADRVSNIAERVAFIVTGNVPAFRDAIRARTVPG